MTADKFVRGSRVIAQLLSATARRSERAEMDGAMQPVSPHYRAVLSARERLLNAGAARPIAVTSARLVCDQCHSCGRFRKQLASRHIG
jgi:hypothetical protein